MKTIAVYILIPAAIIMLRTTAYAMPLHNAAESGDVAEVKQLIEKGADVDAKTTDGWTALMWAADNGHIDAARVLIEKGADVDYAITKLEGLRGDKGYDQSEVETAIAFLKKLAAETVRK